MPSNPQRTRAGTVPIVYLPDRDRWQLTTHSNGKRKRTFYESEKDALTAWSKHCHRVKRFGSGSADYTPEDHAEFREAKRITGGEDLRQVAAFWRAHHPEGQDSTTLPEAASAFLEAQKGKGLSVRHMAALSQHVETFASCFASREVAAISGNDLLDWLRALRFEPRTVRNYAGSLRSFFNWCKRRNLISVSPGDAIHEADLPAARPKAKGVLSVDQCAAMMLYLEMERPKYIPWHVLQLFAGIRRAEVGRLRWDWIDLDAKTITLPGWSEGKRVVKTGDDWVLHDLPDNLWQWLRAYPGTGKIRVPGNDTVESMRADEFPKLGIPEWPQNAMRHTFCTMLMSLHGDAAKVANWSRHTNTAQLYRSYVAKLVSREEAARFIGIAPATSPPPQTAP
jgi:integrase